MEAVVSAGLVASFLVLLLFFFKRFWQCFFGHFITCQAMV